MLSSQKPIIGTGPSSAHSVLKSSSTVLRSQYILEVQGLRGVAALLVSIYHIWFNRVSGGVDAFFVISGYFIATTFIKNDRLQLSDIFSYYLKSIRRIYPTYAVVIVATSIASIFVVPQFFWRNFIKHGFASSAFGENWALALFNVDYLQRGLASSPFQHMWAVSMQMQFYICIPLVFAAAGLIAKWVKIPYRSTLISMFLVGLLASFLYSIYITAHNQTWAYFDSFARAWEFIMGMLVAIIASGLNLNFRHSGFIGTVSALVLVLFASVVSVSSEFPGYLASIPVFATATILLVTKTGNQIRVLRNRVLVSFGSISFAFYLWHWPLLVFARFLTKDYDVSVLVGFSIILCSLLLSIITVKCIELPINRSSLFGNKWSSSVAVNAASMGVALCGLLCWGHLYWVERRAEEAKMGMVVSSPSQFLGNLGASSVPDPIVARLDNPRGYVDGCHQSIWNAEVVTCSYGNPDAPRTVVLVGGSHSLQWLPALEKTAKTYDLSIINITKSACVFTLSADGMDLEHAESCLKWSESVLNQIIELHPDLVITTSTVGRGDSEMIPSSYYDIWKRLEEHSVPVLAIRDNPRPNFNVPLCVELYGTTSVECMVKRGDVLSSNIVFDAKGLTNIHFADFTDLFCSAEHCWPVLDNILIYRDGDHLTKTFTSVYHQRLGLPIRSILSE